MKNTQNILNQPIYSSSMRFNSMFDLAKVQELIEDGYFFEIDGDEQIVRIYQQ